MQNLEEKIVVDLLFLNYLIGTLIADSTAIITLCWKHSDLNPANACVCEMFL